MNKTFYFDGFVFLSIATTLSCNSIYSNQKLVVLISNSMDWFWDWLNLRMNFFYQWNYVQLLRCSVLSRREEEKTFFAQRSRGDDQFVLAQWPFVYVSHSTSMYWFQYHGTIQFSKKRKRERESGWGSFAPRKVFLSKIFPSQLE